MRRVARTTAVLLMASLPSIGLIVSPRPAVAAEGGDPAESGSLETRIHSVKSGDSLWKIAVQELGEGNLWPALYRANRDQIQHPSVLYPGQRLTIPEIASDEKAAIRAEAAQLDRQ